MASLRRVNQNQTHQSGFMSQHLFKNHSTEINQGCPCLCHDHPYHKVPRHCPTMTELVEAINDGQLSKIRRAIRLNARLAMRIHEGNWTLLHHICYICFDPLSSENKVQLSDLTKVKKTIEMIIDASHNELRPLDPEEDYYHEFEDGETEKWCDGFVYPCQQCSCYNLSQYCPPTTLDPVKQYGSQTNVQPGRVLHKSVLTMTDWSGETPLHALTDNGWAHVDIVQVFLDKCRPWSGEARSGKNDRRPALYNLVSAKNWDGKTPLHFLSGRSNDEGLRVILDRLETESFAHDTSCNPKDTLQMTLHPVMIPDKYGDLPLHDASSAPASLISILTTYPGTFLAATICNDKGRLPIDELIVLYKKIKENDHVPDDENRSDGGNNNGHNVEDGISESGEDGNEQTHQRKCNPEQLVQRAIGSMLSTLHEHSAVGGMSTDESTLSSHFQCHLWDRMVLLIQAGANSILSYATGTAPFHDSYEGPQWNPIHASVIVSKYCDFPALALVASIRMKVADMAASSTKNGLDESQLTSKALLQEDSFGLLPLHWACGDIAYLISSSDIKFPDISHSEKHPESTCPETARWRTSIPCSMIQYLLHLCPESARVPTREGRLPLHLFLDGGYNGRYCKENQNSSTQVCAWDDVNALLKACPEALITPDACSNMYPFQIAAAAEASPFELAGERSVDQTERHRTEREQLKSLEMTYRLIMEDPSLCRAL